jgi:phenylacetate-CoA ligase
MLTPMSAPTFSQQVYDFLMRSQYFAPEQMEAQQRNQLEQLVRFAKAKVPFYRNRLDVLFGSSGAVDFARWRDVSILTREDLLTQRETMLTEDLPAGHGLTADHFGSGTTGQSVTTRHNGLISLASNAAQFRAMTWYGFQFNKTLFQWFGGDLKQDRQQQGQNLGPWGPKWDESSRQGSSYELNRTEPVAKALDMILQHKPDYVAGRPNAMLELTQEAEARGARIKIDAMLTFGSAVGGGTREEALRVFGAPIFDFYASKEVYNIAHECPQCSNLHINSELMLVEVLDENNRPCELGQPGRIIVTPFYNTTQPFIRYDLGDMVTLGGPCSCGRTLPVIASLEGRTIHLFRLANGRRMSLRLPAAMRKTIGALEWQAAQVALDKIEIRYLKRADAPQSAFDDVARMVCNQMGTKVDVVFKPLDKMPQTASGKVLDAVCEIT